MRRKKTSIMEDGDIVDFASVRQKAAEAAHAICMSTAEENTKAKQAKQELKVKVKDEAKKSSSSTSPSSASTLRIFHDRLCFYQLPHTW
jgi:ABC-type oligopeptide transport system ATPase subunit